MRIIKPSRLNEYGRTYPKARNWLKAFAVVARSARWGSLADVRKTFPSADRAKGASGNPLVIIDAANHHRLIVAIHYNTQRLYVREFLTHEAYNNQKWKARH